MEVGMQQLSRWSLFNIIAFRILNIPCIVVMLREKKQTDSTHNLEEEKKSPVNVYKQII